ncbi:MAG: hypothetical protein BEN19_05785 [Epulopiscium sp. Nuni2H_MBin003]|nr:MAG: hypothetical protein BEN19_05785 [Epulopiscium sp. Nuni2H_MBin003]
MAKVLRLFVMISLIAVLIVAGVFTYTGYSYYQAVKEERPLVATITSIQKQDRYVELSEISPYFLNALLAIEDRRFFTHFGFDPISIIRASVTNLVAKDIVQGGSTITQQLAKNLFFSSSQTYLRKMAEVFMALDIERNYSKEEILEVYSNIIYLGEGYYGVQDASKGYFKKTPDNLTIEEAAFIAGLAQAPTLYSNNIELGKKRQQIVLDALDDFELVVFD